jgi:outer membrane protein assembly factor BamD (BamD/ComL family)
MTEQATIQCENCGTIFSDLEEVCPYCGQPRPEFGQDEELYPYEDGYEWTGELPPDSDEQFYDEEYVDYADDELLDEAYPPPLAGGYPADALADDDALALAEEELAEDYPAYGEPYDEYSELDLAYDEAYDEPFDEELAPEEYEDFEPEPRRFTKRRLALGCLGILLCAAVFYGGVGLLGAYHGLQERIQLTQAEAESHYQKGQEHLANDSLELAIAEFELALSQNPNLLAARQALRDAQRTAQAQPTPTSETRSAAAESILSTAETQLTDGNWTEAVDTLSQVRDLDPDYQAERVSEMIYTANYQLGLQLLNPDRIADAVLSFEAALSERPEDTEVNVELAKALLYLKGKDAEAGDYLTAVDAYDQLYREDAGYLDVKQRLFRARQAWGDELINQQEWCQAEAQFVEAALLQPSADLDAKTELSTQRCRQADSGTTQTAGPTPRPPAQATRPAGSAPLAGSGTATPSLTSTTTIASTGSIGGKIYSSAYNSNESRWEILAVAAAGGAPQVVVIDGTMPAVSPNGRQLLYRSEAIEQEGFHIFDLTSGEDQRITIVRQDILPRWGGDNNRYLFVAKEPATGRWQIQLGFADGKSDPIILRDGRTPDWSPDGSLIAYQGTDPQGNNPGIYLVPFAGGEETRLTNHESDRTPVFSPGGSQLAFMSTRNGSWDIYTISAAGSAPRQITNGPGNDGLPAWSPDGSQIAYVSDTGGSWGIYIVGASGGTPTRVAGWDGLNRPDWLEAQIWWAR